MKKYSVFVTYQWNEAQDGAIIINEIVDDLTEALAAVATVMPSDFYLDDGDELAELLTADDTDAYTQYCAYVNDDAYFLAVVKPFNE